MEGLTKLNERKSRLLRRKIVAPSELLGDMAKRRFSVHHQPDIGTDLVELNRFLCGKISVPRHVPKPLFAEDVHRDLKAYEIPRFELNQWISRRFEGS